MLQFYDASWAGSCLAAQREVTSSFGTQMPKQLRWQLVGWGEYSRWSGPSPASISLPAAVKMGYARNQRGLTQDTSAWQPLALLAHQHPMQLEMQELSLENTGVSPHSVLASKPWLMLQRTRSRIPHVSYKLPLCRCTDSHSFSIKVVISCLFLWLKAAWDSQDQYTPSNMTGH